MRNYARIAYDPDLLRQLLMLPETAEVLRIDADYLKNVFHVMVNDPTLPEGKPGNLIPESSIVVKSENGKPSFVTYGINAKTPDKPG